MEIYTLCGRGGAWHLEGTRPAALSKTLPNLDLYAALNRIDRAHAFKRSA